jgi:hypothetical protein
MSLALFFLLLAPGLWFWARSLLRGTWRRSAAWFAGTSVLLLFAACFTFLLGVTAGASLDTEEACHQRGQRYDHAYLDEHFEETARLFPLRKPCNADYDLVPAWVNPVLVAFPVPAAGSLAYSGRLVVVRLRRSREPRPAGAGLSSGGRS